MNGVPQIMQPGQPLECPQPGPECWTGDSGTRGHEGELPGETDFWLRVDRLLDRGFTLCGRFPRLSVVAAGLVLVAIVGVIDCVTGPEISLSLFYLLPILAVTHCAGWRAGFLVSVASAVVSLAADLQSLPPPSHIAIPYWNSLARLFLFVVVASLVGSLTRTLQRAHRLAGSDPLTGLRNARSFYECARGEIGRAKRYAHPLSVAFIDLDNFKSVNDRHGHVAGDKVLHLVAATIREHLRETDIVARLGGDEFAVLLPEAPEEAARCVTRKIRDLVSERLHAAGFEVSCSIGSVTFRRPPDSITTMVHLADKLMYAAKREGKNQVAVQVVE